MGVKPHQQIEDTVDDELGRLLKALHQIPRWTQQKHDLYSSIEQRAKGSGYKYFTGDYRTYGLERKGTSCLFDVPQTQRGALDAFRGQRVRLICGGSWDQYAGRYFWVGLLGSGQGDAPSRLAGSAKKSASKRAAKKVKKANKKLLRPKPADEFNGAPILYKGRRVVVIDNRQRHLDDEDYDVVVYDRVLDCVVAWCGFKEDGSLDGVTDYGPHEIPVWGENARDLAQSTLATVNWALQH